MRSYSAGLIYSQPKSKTGKTEALPPKPDDEDDINHTIGVTLFEIPLLRAQFYFDCPNSF
jgi:hypothetical protein